MIRDWLSRAVAWVVGGPLILLVAVVPPVAAVAVVDELLMWADRKRLAKARVRAAADLATAGRISELVPGQRRGEP